MSDNPDCGPSENFSETGIACELPAGHRGEHCAWPPWTWPNEPEVDDDYPDVSGGGVPYEGGPPAALCVHGAVVSQAAYGLRDDPFCGVEVRNVTHAPAAVAGPDVVKEPLWCRAPRCPKGPDLHWWDISCAIAAERNAP